MKKFLFLLGGLLSSWAITAQTLTESDAAILFAGEDINGSARYNAMSGAFGALGGDHSAIDINPAGLAVFKNSGFSASVGYRDTDIETSFYDNNITNNDNYFDLNQVGGALVFDTGRGSDIRKFAIGFNYSISRDFQNNWFASGIPTDSEGNAIAPLTDIEDPDVLFGNFEGTDFQSSTAGSNDKLVLAIASQPNDKVYIGAAINFYNIDFSQLTVYEEFNSDDDGNTLDILAEDRYTVVANGVSFNVGLIAKPSQEMRLGVSYQSPTWYDVSQEQVVFDTAVFENGTLITNDGSEVFVFDYNLTTPGKLTGSFAYLFGKEGLISFDYSYKDYKNLELRPTAEFGSENQFFSDNLQGSSEFRVGAEWRLDNVSLRGGYRFEESPFRDALDSDHISGYSVGLGFKFKGNARLDLAYQSSNNTDIYNFVNSAGAEAADLDITNDRFTATLVIGL
ncbi:MAG: outer membrane protein transport protein [Flavobacteriaceae bacterium]|nr:outer membrane protein transport protein [Flavobacteriaceae bacterium]